MKIYHLKAIDIKKFTKRYRKSCPSIAAVVVSENEEDARKTAAENCGKAYLNAKYVSCEEINPKEFECRRIIMSNDCVDLYNPLYNGEVYI